ncbi:hypothetical protein ACWEU6_37115 [Streptosporangium sandarakinum]|uniref:hypothetical protein n=1 Tax=Streptosporangium sandarakinum TaxID=1260955 RepID=UPI0036859F17
MNTELAKAWAHAPGIVELTAAITRLRSIPTGATNPAVVLADQLTEQLLTGGELPDPAELGRRAIAARQAAADQAAAAQILAETSTKLGSRLADARRAGAPTALAHLGKRLAETLDQVRDLAPRLGAVKDRDQAWNAPAEIQDVWRQLEDLNRTYTEIRRAQTEVTSAITNSIPSPHGGSVALADVVRLGVLDLAGLPDIADFTTATDVNGHVVDRGQPWPTVNFGMRYTVTHLLWLTATPKAKPWIPTTKQQIAQAFERHQNAQSNANKDNTTRYEQFI